MARAAGETGVRALVTVGMYAITGTRKTGAGLQGQLEASTTLARRSLDWDPLVPLYLPEWDLRPSSAAGTRSTLRPSGRGPTARPARRKQLI
jgi:hypothetical protein